MSDSYQKYRDSQSHTPTGRRTVNSFRGINEFLKADHHRGAHHHGNEPVDS